MGYSIPGRYVKGTISTTITQKIIKYHIIIFTLHYTQYTDDEKIERLKTLLQPGADPGFDQGGAPERDRPKTAILGPQFCRILVLGPHFW